jgi:hypothetical protein
MRDDAKRKREARNLDRHKPYRTPPKAVVKMRNRLEKDPAKWLRYYLPERYPLPFGDVHRQIIISCTRAMIHGTSITVAAPRGFGKTAILWGMSLYGVLTGLCRFPVVIGWKANAGLELLDQWLQSLSGNDRLAEAYPCICDPFQDSTSSNRLKGILRDVESETRAGCDVRKGRGMVLLPDVREDGRTLPQAALAGASMNGSIKGMNVGLLNGESLRPDIVLLDDPQDEATADSKALVDKVIKKIDYGIRSLSGPRRRLTVMAAVTCVNADDVSDHLLTRPGTEVVRIGQIVTWPDGWEDKTGKARELWDEWNKARLTGLENMDGGKAARVYYRKFKKQLAAGMAVSWKERYHIGDGRRASDPDALFAAMWDFYDLGEAAFMAERQNSPLELEISQYHLTAEMIMAHAVNLPRLHIPDQSTVFVGHCDINRAGLHWCLAAYDQLMTGHTPAYGKWPERGDLWDKNASELDRKQAIFRGLRELCAGLAATVFIRAGQQLRLGLLLVDRGYEPDVVHKFAAAAVYPFRVLPARGYAAHKYCPRKNLLVGKPMEGCHVTRSDMGGTYLAFNADMWRETAQRAFLADPGAPGGFTLYQAPDQRHHQRFADQVTAEKLSNKYETDSGMRWEWRQQPGSHWDWGDALTGCWVAAAFNGLSASGEIRAPNKRPKARVVIKRPGR